MAQLPLETICSGRPGGAASGDARSAPRPRRGAVGENRFLTGAALNRARGARWLRKLSSEIARWLRWTTSGSCTAWVLSTRFARACWRRGTLGAAGGERSEGTKRTKRTKGTQRTDRVRVPWVVRGPVRLCRGALSSAHSARVRGIKTLLESSGTHHRCVRAAQRGSSAGLTVTNGGRSGSADATSTGVVRKAQPVRRFARVFTTLNRRPGARAFAPQGASTAAYAAWRSGFVARRRHSSGRRGCEQPLKVGSRLRSGSAPEMVREGIPAAVGARKESRTSQHLGICAP